MQIKLYKTQSKDCALNKVLTNELVINGEMKGEVLNILEPEITLEYKTIYNNYNYAYIPEYSRYYFISDVNKINHYTVMTFHHDALMNWRNEILDSEAQVTRTNPSKGSKYLKDNRISSTAQHFYETKKLGAGFTKQDNYMIIIASPKTSE